MLRFLLEFAIYFALMALATLPLALAAKYAQRRYNRKKWLRGAAITALIVAGLGWSSRDLVSSCRSERNEGCIDIGGVGSQVLFVAAFVIVALGNAYLTYRD